MKLALLVSLVSFHSLAMLQALEPLHLEKGELVYSRDFEDGAPLDKERWKEIQHSRWKVEEGKAVGRPSSEEARKQIIAEQIAAGKGERAGRSHIGDLARLNIRKIPQDGVIMEMKFKMVGGIDRNSRYHRIIEFGIHGARVQFEVERTVLRADHDKLVLKEDPWILPDDEWCTVLAEYREDELVIQIKDGPTLRGKHESWARKRGGPIVVNLYGKKEGEVHIEHLKFWEGLQKVDSSE